jgi:hypothetical protein
MSVVRFFSLPIVVIILFVLIVGLQVAASLNLGLDELNIRWINPFVRDQEPGISKTPDEPLLFGVFTFANDSKSMSVLRQQYSTNNPNHYVIHSIRSLPGQLWLYDALPAHRKMIIIQALDNITDAIKVGQRYDLDIIVYDIEQWERTPKVERADPPLSIMKGAAAVHQAGYRYGIIPDAPTLMDNYKKINWTEIDFLGMQLQRFSQNLTEYSDIAKEVSTFVRSENPNIEIFTQLSFRFTDANDMIKIIENVKDMVNGFIIFYDASSQSCISTCSPHELNLVLDKINGLTRHGSNYTIS